MNTECSRFAPLSPGQRRMWFIDQFAPNSPVYNEPLLAVRIRGALNVAALRRAIGTVVQRHEILRTLISIGPEGPRQEIFDSRPLHFRQIDLRRSEDPESRMWSIARAEARRTFDLAYGPLMRVTLLQLAADQYLLLVAMHHVVSDGWSLRVFLSELLMLYQAELAKSPPPLPPLPAQYADYAVWIERELAGRAGERLATFWRERLSGPLPRIGLPYDYARPQVQRYIGNAESFEMPKEWVDRLNKIARQNGCTLFVVLLSVFSTVLHCIAGTEHIAVGTPVANRTRSDWEPLIGFFVNVIVLKLDLSGNPTFADLLKRARTVVLDAFEHQELPFDRTVEIVAPDRETNRQPFFDVMVAHHNFPVRRYRTSDLEFERIDLEENDAKYDLVLLTVEIEGGRIQAQLIYDVDLFSKATIRHMLQALRSVLASIDTTVGQRLNRIGNRCIAERSVDAAEEQAYLERLRTCGEGWSFQE